MSICAKEDQGTLDHFYGRRMLKCLKFTNAYVLGQSQGGFSLQDNARPHSLAQANPSET